MPECYVHENQIYYLPSIPLEASYIGGRTHRPEVLGQYDDQDRRDPLWGRVRRQPNSMTFIKYDEGWAAAEDVTVDDIEGGHRTLLGGYQHEVTGQDLYDMVADGAITSEQACSARVKVVLYGLVTDDGSRIYDDQGNWLHAAVGVSDPGVLLALP